MFSRLTKAFDRSPLTDKWLSKNATPCHRSDFEIHALSQNGVAMYHSTNLANSQSIFKSGKMFGIDVVSTAHFHYTPDEAMQKANHSGAVLGFVWGGDCSNVDVSNYASCHRDRRPNVLFDVPVNEFDDSTWELRMYPGSSGLALAFIEVDGQSYLLNQPRSISVTLDQ